MPNVKSYAWSEALKEAVPIDGEVDVPTPGFENPENYKTDEIEAVIGGTVIPPEQFSFSWEADFSHVYITNETAGDWPPGETLSVTVAGKEFGDVSAGGDLAALEARVAANEAAIADLTSRVTALETAGGTTQAAQGGLRPGPGSSASRNPEKGQNNPPTGPGKGREEDGWSPKDIQSGKNEENSRHGKAKPRK